MKISEKWLREWVNPDVSTDELVEQITMAGLEVDGIEGVAGDFTGVVVGEILSIEQHPDKLRVCQVAGGDEVVQVVCGAPNARAGIKIPFATVGAKLPSEDAKGFNIKKAKLRGVESFGMLCAEKELDLSDADEGLMELAADAPVGTDLRDYLELDDTIIEVDLTPNRADCLSIAGIKPKLLRRLLMPLPHKSKTHYRLKFRPAPIAPVMSGGLSVVLTLASQAHCGCRKNCAVQVFVL